MAKDKKNVRTKEADDNELIADLQRLRADFENYRKRSELDKVAAKQSGRTAAISTLLPVIDTIERAILHTPEDISGHPWVKGINTVVRQMDGTLKDIGLKRILASQGTIFDPHLHEAIQFNEDAEGEKEVIDEELRAGYLFDDTVLRPALVKVTRK